jgi:hypothetical protein
MVELNRKSVVHFIKKAAKEKASTPNLAEDKFFNNSSLINSDSISNGLQSLTLNSSPQVIENSMETIEEADISGGDIKSDMACWDDEKLDDTCK